MGMVLVPFMWKSTGSGSRSAMKNKNILKMKVQDKPETRAQQKAWVSSIAKFESWSLLARRGLLALFPLQAEGDAHKEAASYQAEETISKPQPPSSIC